MSYVILEYLLSGGTPLLQLLLYDMDFKLQVIEEREREREREREKESNIRERCSKDSNKYLR